MANDFSGDPNVVALYNLENGALTTDSSGNGETLTNSAVTNDLVNFKQGSASALANVVGDSLERVDVGLAADFPGKGGTTNRTFSACLWYRPTTFGAFGWLVSKWNSGAGNRSWAIQQLDVGGSNDQIRIQIGYNGGASNEALGPHAGVDMALTTWYHIGVTYDGASRAWRIRIYEDGGSASESTGTGTQTMSPDSGAFNIFDSDSGLSSGVIGSIDEVVVWNRVISAAEIDQVRSGTFAFGIAGGRQLVNAGGAINSKLLVGRI